MDSLIDVTSWPDRAEIPLVFPWPMPGNLGGLLEFRDPSEWIRLIRTCDLSTSVPEAYAARFRQAQKLYALAWLEFGVIKAAELAALAALEAALKARYGEAVRARTKRKPMLSSLLRHLVEVEGLIDADLPCVRRHGGTVVPHLYETDAEKERRGALEDANPGKIDSIRNRLAHGDPFETAPWGGLLEVTRDLIEFAYR